MRARTFNKRIELWETTSTADGYGGNIVTDFLVTSSWAKIKTFNPGGRNNSTTDFGILNTQNAITITFRKRNDITYNTATQYVKYRGNKYIITTDPTNIDFEDSYIQFIGQRQNEKQNVELSDLAKQALAESISLAYMIRVNEDGGSVEDYDCLVSQIKDTL